MKNFCVVILTMPPAQGYCWSIRTFVYICLGPHELESQKIDIEQEEGDLSTVGKRRGHVLDWLRRSVNCKTACTKRLRRSSGIENKEKQESKKLDCQKQQQIGASGEIPDD
jgi:hypothetical protein